MSYVRIERFSFIGRRRPRFGTAALQAQRTDRFAAANADIGQAR